MIPPRKTRSVRIRDLLVGAGAPIAVQSMAATRTQDLAATLNQVRILEEAGADLVRIAVDSKADVEALATIRAQTSARLSVDLQENYRLAEFVAPHVDKIRYNPGHLHHHEKHKSVAEKVAWIVGVAREHKLALRIGVNAGSVAPEYLERFPKADDEVRAIVASAVDHCALCDELGFANYVVSIKDSDPRVVIEANQRFAEARPDVPLHLGVTEAGMPPDGVIKTRIAFEQLVSRGIGDTLRVSLTVPFDDKGLETLAKEFSVDAPSVQAVLEMIDAGLCPPFVGRFRRAQTGGLSETQVRRLRFRRQELEELDRRRGTILRTLERVEGVAPSALDSIRNCMDRFEIEDLFVPHRRPEPEVQLALDRGLGALADLLVKQVPRPARPKLDPAEEAAASEESPPESTAAEPTTAEETPAPASETAAEPVA